MNKKCLACGKDLRPFAINDKGTDCARDALRQTFQQYPELGQAWKDACTSLRDSLSRNEADELDVHRICRNER